MGSNRQKTIFKGYQKYFRILMVAIIFSPTLVLKILCYAQTEMSRVVYLLIKVSVLVRRAWPGFK